MILSTTEAVAGRTVLETLGMVRGTTVRARHVGRDISALLSNIVGGEVTDYTKLLAEAREQALDRMRAEALALGADAVVGLRFSANQISAGCAEILVYGTAVRLAPQGE